MKTPLKTLSELNREYHDLAQLLHDQRQTEVDLRPTLDAMQKCWIELEARNLVATEPEKLLLKIETALSNDALELLKDEIASVRSTGDEFDEIVAAFDKRKKELADEKKLK